MEYIPVTYGGPPAVNIFLHGGKNITHLVAGPGEKAFYT